MLRAEVHGASASAGALSNYIHRWLFFYLRGKKKKPRTYYTSGLLRRVVRLLDVGHVGDFSPPNLLRKQLVSWAPVPFKRLEARG
jgi:hypothetical protein